MEDTFLRYEQNNRSFEQRQDDLTKVWHSSNPDPLPEPQRTALHHISLDMTNAETQLTTRKVQSDTGAPVENLFQKVISVDNGLEQDHRNVLVEALDGVQQAWIKFADTLAAVFAVKTKPVTT